MKEVDTKYNYIIEPHGAVGYLALKEWQKDNPNTQGIILETAHASKFIDDVEEILGKEIAIPERLAILAERKKESTLMNTEFNNFKKWLLANY